MIADLKPYPAYKDSGVPSLGQVPEHWEVQPLVRIGRLSKGNGGSKADEVSEGIPCVRYGDLYTRHEFFIRETKACVALERAASYTTIHYGDVLFAASGETIEDIGRSAENLLDCEARCGGDVLLLRPTKHFEPGFLGYAADSPASRSQKASMGRGFTVVHIYASELKGLALAVPPLPEQAAIVRFLDHANRRIRQYSAAKRKLISLLNEQKQAIIHRAVTRGLDPNVRLKPSGVEWLGDVPEHWEVTQLHRITDPQRPVMYGIVLPGPDVENGVFIVKGGNCEPGKLRKELLSKTTYEIEARYTRSRLRKEDIVFAIRGGVGAAEMVPKEIEGANLTQDAARIAANAGVYPRWLLYAVRAPVFQAQVDARILGATVRGINIRDLKRIYLCVPPREEQESIAKHLEAEMGQIEASIEHIRREMDLLREYRIRLIADVVTGKLEVREAAAKLPDEEDEPEPLDEIEEPVEGTEAPDLEAELEPEAA